MRVILCLEGLVKCAWNIVQVAVQKDVRSLKLIHKILRVITPLGKGGCRREIVYAEMKSLPSIKRRLLQRAAFGLI